MAPPLPLYIPRPVRRRPYFSLWRRLIVALALALGAYYLPGLFTRPPYTPAAPGLVIEGQDLGAGLVRREKGEVLVPVPVLKEHLDPHLFWDEKEKLLTVTTADRVVRLPEAKLTAFVNAWPVKLTVPVEVHGSTPYAPLTFLARLYELEVHYDEHAAVVAVTRRDRPHRTAALRLATPLRSGPSFASVRRAALAAGERVTVYEEKGIWLHVQAASGLTGYILRSAAGAASLVPARSSLPTAPRPWRPPQGKVNLTWEYVHQRTPDWTSIGPLPGVNVISPTWFHLATPEGELTSRADPAFVRAAHARGLAVWALISNNFDPDLTRAVLSSTARREKVIRQLLAYAHLLTLDGLNIDFENMYRADSRLFVQFLRELTPLARAQGLTVSVDVTVPSESENWSQVYDRKAIAEAVDYVALMAYDEHWATSPEAGSVASLPWTEAAIQATLREVPREKLLLGLPLYTRLWEEHALPGGGAKVTSTALSLRRARIFLAQNGLTPRRDPASGQNYVEFTRGATTFKLWLEDETSLQARLTLAQKYRLAGVASWQRGYAEPWVWELLAREP